MQLLITPKLTLCQLNYYEFLCKLNNYYFHTLDIDSSILKKKGYGKNHWFQFTKEF